MAGGSPFQPLISTQHCAGNNSIQIQVPTDNTGNKERFEYQILAAADPGGLHFDNARYSGFAFTRFARRRVPEFGFVLAGVAGFAVGTAGQLEIDDQQFAAVHHRTLRFIRGVRLSSCRSPRHFGCGQLNVVTVKN